MGSFDQMVDPNIYIELLSRILVPMSIISSVTPLERDHHATGMPP